MNTPITWKTEKRKVSKLIPFEKNPRKITPAAMEKLKDRIRKRGFHDVIKVDTKGVVLSGNMRTEALIQLGIKEIEVMVPDRALTKSERDAVMLESNRNDGAWDNDMLVEFGSEVLLEAGFDSLEVDGFLRDDESVTAEDDFDLDAETEKITKPKSRRGDVFELGDHRLMCGDATKREEVAKLMNGKNSTMVFTDPPWNVGIGVSNNPKMKHRPGGLLNDDLGMDFVKFLIDMSLTISEFNDGDIYCVISYSELHNMHPAFLKAGLHWSGTIAWVKDQFVIGRSKYHRRYETIWYGWKTKSSYVGDRKQDDVWEIPRPKSSLEHPTMKPVELVNKAIMNSSKRGDIVLDLFGGGGSTIVAAEKSGRHARLMELDPKYVDVIIKRWEMLTGQKAKKI